MKLELHTHNYYSLQEKVLYDAVNSPEEMISQASKNKIDAVVISDHDTLDAIPRSKKSGKKEGIEIIPGCEITTEKGHLLAVNIQEEIKKNLSVEETMDKIHEQGGIGIASHPFDILSYGIGKYSKYCDAMEIFNPLNVDRLSNIKSKIFSNKFKIPKVTGSDAHSTKMLNHGVVEVNADSIEQALKKITQNKTTLHTKYFSMETMRDITIKRFTMSYDHTSDYIKKYSWPKRYISEKLLNSVVKGKYNKTLKFVSYIALGSVILYSGFKTITGYKTKPF